MTPDEVTAALEELEGLPLDERVERLEVLERELRATLDDTGQR